MGGTSRVPTLGCAIMRGCATAQFSTTKASFLGALSYYFVGSSGTYNTFKKQPIELAHALGTTNVYFAEGPNSGHRRFEYFATSHEICVWVSAQHT